MVRRDFLGQWLNSSVVYNSIITPKRVDSSSLMYISIMM